MSCINNFGDINETFIIEPLVLDDTFVTGFTLSSNNIVLTQNRIDQYSAFTITLSGLTGSSLNVYVTGGTYNNTTGTATFVNSTGGTFQVTGFTTGSTSTASGAYLPLSGGTVTGNTIFQSGLTASTISATTISGGTFYGDGSKLTGIIASAQFTGGTVNGPTNFISGLTANTISATTYQNLPKDIFVTGGTYSGSSIVFTNNSGGTFNVSGITSSATFTGGTVSGATIFTSGLTADTISATTYLNLPVTADTFVTGFTLTSNTITLTQNTTGQFSAFTISLSAYTGGSTTVTGNFLPLSGGTVSGNTFFTSGLTANTLTVTGNTNLSNITANTLTVTGNTRLAAVTANTLNVTGSTRLDGVTADTLTVTGNTRLAGLTASTISSNTLTVSATTNPVTFIGLTADTSDTRLLSVGTSGIIHTYPISGLTTAITSTNIYNSNGTLTSNRVMNMSAYTLTLSGKTNINYSSTTFTDSPLVIRNTSLNSPISSVISFDCDATGVDQPVFMNFASTIPKGFGFYASSSDITSTPDGAAFQMYNNASVNFPGQLFFDSGANNNAAIIFRTAQSAGVITERIRITSDGNVGIGTTSPTTKLHIYATTDPIRVEGVQTSTDTELLTIDGGGVVHKVSVSSVGAFLRNETNPSATDTININQSIFNPSNLTVLSSSTFIVDTNADYYVLGDFYNSGTTIVNGTLKVGGNIYNSGTITGSGIIE